MKIEEIIKYINMGIIKDDRHISKIPFVDRFYDNKYYCFKDYYFCPFCSKFITNSQEFPTECEYCHQKIDWSLYKNV